MRLTSKQYTELTEALLSDFHTKAHLEEFLKFRLDKNLSTITHKGDLKGQIFEVVRVSENEGWLEELVKSASSSNPINHFLKDFSRHMNEESILAKRRAWKESGERLDALLKAKGIDPENLIKDFEEFYNEPEPILTGEVNSTVNG